MNTVRVATRKSPLAVWQAEHVCAQLKQYHPDLNTELVMMTTSGDKTLDKPLATIGGKGLFLKELETGLLKGKADIAVHSMKDVTVELPPGLCLVSYCKRENPMDAFVSNKYDTLAQLPVGAKVGTSSLRRQCQIKYHFPELEIITLRGNVNTRLAKLDNEEYDAIILAVAGLKRLELDYRIKQVLEPEMMLPAVGQGIMGIECRQDDQQVIDIVHCLNDRHSQNEIEAERSVNAALQGGCQVPIAAFAQHVSPKQLRLRALVGSPDGVTLLQAEDSGSVGQAIQLGRKVADDLMDQGAMEILHQVYGQN